MSRRLVAIVIGVPFLVTGAIAQQPTFRARTDLVSVAVSVTKGRAPVTGLAPADFELTDNGVRQTVDTASLDRVPIDLTLVLTAFSAERTTDQDDNLVSAAATRALLLPDDRLRLVTIDDDVRGVLVGSDSSIEAESGVRQWARGRPLSNGWVARIEPGQKLSSGVALADGLFYALAWPVDPDRRHLVVAFTDGWDTASVIEMTTLPKLAAHSDAVFHAVIPRTPGEDNRGGGGRNTSPLGPGQIRQWQTSFNLVDDVVERTGGTLQRTSKAADALAEIIADFRSSYLLRYTPRNVQAAGWHELKVKVTRPGSFTIRARRGYEGS